MADVFDKCDEFWARMRKVAGEHFDEGVKMFFREFPVTNCLPTVTLDGTEHLQVSTNDYLGLATHPEVVAAATEIVQESGVGTPLGARPLTGNTELHLKLEADLAKFGALVAQARTETITNLQREITVRETIFPQSLIGLNGTLENQFQNGRDLTSLADSYRDRLATERQIDMRAGRTLTGPHRTELHVTHKAKAMPAALCSTGEQKALLIGLILAQARALAERHPILLLDEVAAHLDSLRRAALAEELLDLGLQVFMTGTDKTLFSDFGARAQIMQVADGQLS